MLNVRDLILKNRGIAIFGCGMEANALYYRLSNLGIKVDYFIDNYRTEPFWGHVVERLDEALEKHGRLFFYIPSKKYYSELKIQLTEKGYREFEDFVRGDAFEKRIIYINANCYGPKIKECLESNSEFREKYCIYYATPFFLEKADFDNTPYLSNCDVYIHQDIRKDNPYGEKYSDEYTSVRVKDSCRKIVIPNLVGMGKIYYQQAYFIEDNKNEDAGALFGVFPQGDRIVDDLYMELNDIELVFDTWKKGNFNLGASAVDVSNEVIRKFRERERKWDVKIIDYIERNYKSIQLFYDLYHPTNIVYEKISLQLLELLDIKGKTIKQRELQNEYELPIYPEIAKALKLEFWSEDAKIRDGSMFKFTDNMDMEEWIKEYLMWCYKRRG